MFDVFHEPEEVAYAVVPADFDFVGVVVVLDNLEFFENEFQLLDNCCTFAFYKCPLD